MQWINCIHMCSAIKSLLYNILNGLANAMQLALGWIKAIESKRASEIFL